MSAGGARALSLWVVMGAVSSAATATATPAPPMAAVFVDAAPDTEAFVLAYVSEIASEHLRQGGYAVIPPQVAARALAAGGEGCVERDECLLETALGLQAVVFLVLEPSAPATGTIALTMRAFRLGNELERAETGEATGDVVAVAEAIAGLVVRHVSTPPRCLLHLIRAGEAELRVDGEVRAPTSDRVVVTPGEHRLEMRRPGRSPWSGSLVCEAGKRFRVTVR